MRARAWRDKWLWWLPALVLLAINLMAWGWFEMAYSGAAQSLAGRVERRTAEADQVEALVDRQREVLARVTRASVQVEKFSSSRLASREERLTTILREVSSLAAKAGLEPSSFSYPEDDATEYGVVKRWVVFSISGTYMELRRFINLLELSDSFLTLEAVGLSSREKGELRISLSVSTLFSSPIAESPRAGGRAR
jgi:type IV pilus assembly protein PilO